MEIKIRPMQSQEISECAQMIVNSNPWLKLGISAKSQADFLSRNIIEKYVALLGTEIVGIVALNRRGFASQPYIPIFFVNENYRRNGFGKRMMDFMEQDVFSKDSNLFLTVSSFNKDAKMFYEKLGFVSIGKLNDYIISGCDEIVMRKTKGPIKR